MKAYCHRETPVSNIQCANGRSHTYQNFHIFLLIPYHQDHLLQELSSQISALLGVDCARQVPAWVGGRVKGRQDG